MRPTSGAYSRGGRRTVALLAALALAGMTHAPASAASPKPLDAKLQRPDGTRLRLDELRGQPLLLDLWATWCLPCREQARILDALGEELARRGIAVLSVNQGESRQEVLDFLAAHPSDFAAALDRGQVVSRLLDVGELPALALLDRDGVVVGVRLGLTREPELLELLSAVDGE